MHGGVETGLNGVYVGTDRRTGRTAGSRSVVHTDLVAFATLLALIGLALPTVLAELPSLPAAEHAQTALRTGWAMLFVCAGVLRLVRWRLTGETRTALLGCALVCFGVLSPSTSALAGLIHDAPRDVWLTPVTRAVAVTVCLVLLTRTLRSAPVDTRVRPLRLILRCLGVAVLSLAAAISLAQAGHPIALPDRAWAAIGLAITVAWLALALQAGVQGFRQQSSSLQWVAVGLLLLGVAELLQSLAFVVPTTIVFYATCLRVVVGVIAVTNAGRDLTVVLSNDGNQLLRLRGALLETQEQQGRQDRDREERLHDARSLICALKAASLTLDRYDERLDTAVKHRLRSSLVSELDRLERVIEGRRQEPVQVFRLDVALAPVFVAERENGLVINNQLGSIRATGRAVELASVMHNLLVNARHHAPGSPVRVHATTTADGGVQIFVEDRGPGVGATEQERVFDRGYQTASGADAEGSGLGLYLARRLMREQSGEIVLRERPGGGACFVLALPGASGREAAEDDVSAPASAPVQLATSRLAARPRHLEAHSA